MNEDLRNSMIKLRTAITASNEATLRASHELVDTGSHQAVLRHLIDAQLHTTNALVNLLEVVVRGTP